MALRTAQVLRSVLVEVGRAKVPKSADNAHSQANCYGPTILSQKDQDQLIQLETFEQRSPGTRVRQLVPSWLSSAARARSRYRMRLASQPARLCGSVKRVSTFSIIETVESTPAISVSSERA